MDILIHVVGLNQLLIPGHMGQNPQLNLRVVRVHKDTALPGHEHLPDPPPKLHAHGNVLQIGLSGADPPGGRDGLVKAGVDPPVLPDIDCQPVRIG